MLKLRCSFPLLLLAAAPAAAEKVPMTVAELKKTATHIVTGQVNAVFSRTDSDENWKYQRYVAEVVVANCEKGDGLKPKEPVYIRYWTREWIGKGQVPPSTIGHRDLPSDGQFIRVYLARNAYDGFGGTSDGGFNVIGANGFERSKLASDNCKALFDRVETGQRARPGEFTRDDLESLLGPGESIDAKHPDLASAPGADDRAPLTWVRWGFANEVLLVGFANGKLSAVVRLKR